MDSKYNPEKKRLYYLKNKERISNYNKIRSANPSVKEKKKIYLKEYSKKYRKLNKEKIRDWTQQWLEKNRIEYNARKSKWVTNKRRNNISFKLAHNLRSRLRKALQDNYKSGSTVRDLGCSIEEFKWWLEFWFEEGMTWDNYGLKKGQWSMDHIIPLTKIDLTNREQFLIVSNYKNIQPMWHVDNQKKGNKWEKPN